MSADRAIRLRAIIEGSKDDLLGRYFIFKNALIGVFAASLHSPRTPSAISRVGMQARLSQIGSDAARIERAAISKTTGDILDQFGGESELSAALTAEGMVNLQADVVAQLSRDSRVVLRRFSHIQLALSISPGERANTIKSQAIEQISNKDIFTYRDSIGKIWRSTRYLETRASKFYYNLTNDIVATEMVSFGDEKAILNRPQHESDGMVIDLAQIESLAGKYFHPGSQAILA